jgi:hypothetical protein
MEFNPLHNFISPVTGRLPIQKDYVLVGDHQGFSIPSPILIDIRLDILQLKKDVDDIIPFPIDASFIIKAPDVRIPNAQALNTLSNGIMVNNLGAIETTETININNLPPLGLTSVPNPFTGGFVGKVWEGNAVGRPEQSNIVGEMFTDIVALNARFLLGEFVMGDALVQATYPKAQFLINLEDGILKKTGKVLEHAVSGTDYVDAFSNPIERILPVWQVNNSKLLVNTGVSIDGQNRISGIDTVNTQFVIASDQITSNTSIFGLNDVGTREVKIYDYWNGAGRLTKSVNLKGPGQLNSNLTWIMPSAVSTTGQALLDIGNNLVGERLLGFSNISPTDASYILNKPHEHLTNAQAISELAGGILKGATGTGTISIASGGKVPVTNDYVRPIDLQEEILETRAFSTAEATAAELSAVVTSTAYFNTQMLPYSLIPAITAGISISGAITATTALATSAQSSANDANSRISNLSAIIDDKIGSKLDYITTGDNTNFPIRFTRALHVDNNYDSFIREYGTYGYLNPGGRTGVASDGPTYDIKCNNRIRASEVNVWSSKNIKNILARGQIIQNEAANLIQTLPTVKYNYKNPSLDGKGNYYGMISEEIKDYLPDYVTSEENKFAPNIMKQATATLLDYNTIGIIIENAERDYPDIIDKKIQIIAVKNACQGTVLSILGNTITVKTDFALQLSEKTIDVFVYGTYEDCPTIAKMHLFDMALCALQNCLSRIQQLENKV